MRINRYIITVLLILSIMMMSLLAGCGSKSTVSSTPARKYDIVKVMTITDLQGAKWKTYQLRLTLDAGATFTIDLNLANGDKIDCYYITENPATGGSVNFQIKAGDTVVYPPSTAVSATPGNTSDSFIVTATQTNGSSYRLIYRNTMPDKNSKETIYTEIKYPANGAGDDSIFIPLETN
jgi:hypothetical protein